MPKKKIEKWGVAEKAEKLWEQFSEQGVTELVDGPARDRTYTYGFRWTLGDLRIVSVLVLKTGLKERIFILGPAVGAQVDRLQFSCGITNNDGIFEPKRFREEDHPKNPATVRAWVEEVRQKVTADPGSYLERLRTLTRTSRGSHEEPGRSVTTIASGLLGA